MPAGVLSYRLILKLFTKEVMKMAKTTVEQVVKDLHKEDIKTSLNKTKKIMTIAKSDDAKQSIVINGWDAATHDIKYADDMKAFSTYLAATKPKVAQVNAARNEVWKKVGLAVS